MTSSNKNTWFVYYCLIALGAILLCVNINNRYNELLSEKKYEQQYITKIVASDIDSTLAKYETMIDLVNEDFNEDQNLNQNIIKNILHKSDLLIGFLLYNTDGTLHTKSDNLPESKRYRLKPEQHYYSWFLSGLKTDKMMINKPRFSPILKQWVIPIQKRLVDHDGNVIGMMTSFLDLKKLESRWSSTKAFGNNIELTLDKQFYQLLHTGINLKEHQKIHNNPLAFRQMDNTKRLLAEQNLTIEKLRNNNIVAQIIGTINDEKVLISIAYSQHYPLWAHSSRPLNSLTKALIYSSLYYTALYLLLLIIAFFLFKRIVRTEESKIAELTYKTEHDDLTGCYNQAILARLFEKFKNNQKHFSLLYIDLDNFKNINDSFGHQYGDILLKEVSFRLQNCLDDFPGTLIRYSGDKFILLIETANKELVRNFTTKLLSQLAKFHIINETSLSLTCSIGITRYPDDSKSLDTLISYAENSMAIAKKVKNQYLFFSQKVHQKLIKQAQIEQALHHAIDANEISLVYQPQLDQKGNLYGVEALVRWHSEKLGFIPPTEFIPVAEETGLMPKLGQYIMNTAMEEIATLQKQLGKTFALSINVSVKQFIQINFFDLLTSSIQQYGNAKLPITIEITESLFIESIDVLLPIFQLMKANNISLALDDFGTGYSSLSMLKDAPIDELKIDKSFVDHITNNETDQAMVKSIIGIGKNLNMRVLAEGVETAEHAKILENAGCDLFQGYHFSHPLKIEDLYDYAK